MTFPQLVNIFSTEKLFKPFARFHSQAQGNLGNNVFTLTKKNVRVLSEKEAISDLSFVKKNRMKVRSFKYN